MTAPLPVAEAREALKYYAWHARVFFNSDAMEQAAKLSPLPPAELEAWMEVLDKADQAGDTARIEQALDALLTDPRETTTSSPRHLPLAAEANGGDH